MTQQRHIWRIGMFEFTASLYNGGWLLSGFVEQAEVFEETYYEGSIQQIKGRSANWARALSEELFCAANNLEIK